MAVEVTVEHSALDAMEAEADQVRKTFLDAVSQWKPDQFTYRVLMQGGSVVRPPGQARLTRDPAGALHDFFKALDEGRQRISGGSVHATARIPWTPGA